MSTVETLKAVKALIEDPKRWTQGEYARNAKGRKVSPTGKAGTCFCVAGALRRVTRKSYEQSAKEWLIVWRASERLFKRGPYQVNDDLGHEAVMQVLDAAIAEAAIAEAEKAG